MELNLIKTIELEDLTIDDKDADIILACKVADLRKQGYRGLVLIDAFGLYDIEKYKIKPITSFAIYGMMMS